MRFQKKAPLPNPPQNHYNKFMTPTQVKIDAFLKKNHITPQFPYVPDATVHTNTSTFAWQNNYSTYITKNGREYFLKININPEHFQELKKQVLFMQLLQKQSLTFVIPHIYEWSFDHNLPYYIAEKIEGDMLGNCVCTNEQFANEKIFDQLIQGLREITTIDKHRSHWLQTKDESWIKERCVQVQKDKKILSILGEELADKIIAFIQNAHYRAIGITPLWGDPAPNNFIVTTHNALALIDYKPFCTGYKNADMLEFSSFCIFSQKWEKLVQKLHQDSNEIDKALYALFLIDRLYSLMWLEKRNEMQRQLHKPPKFYLDTIIKHLQRI